MCAKCIKLFVLFAAVLLLCVFCFFFLTSKQSVLVITNADDGREWSFPLPDGQFSLCFTHSVMKTPVEEIYTVDSSNLLVLVETVYQSYGVGLPFLPEEGELVTENGRFVLKLQRQVGSLSMVISPLAGHYLKVGGSTVPFEDLVGPSSARVSIEARERPVWFWDKDFAGLKKTA